MIKNDEIDLIINTTEGKRAIRESHSIRREAELRKLPSCQFADVDCVRLPHRLRRGGSR